MFRKAQDIQISIYDHYLNATEQAVKTVEKSRARMVGDFIYPNVDETKFMGLFSEKGSRPNIPIAAYVSALILKQMYGLSDEVFLEFLRCGALNFQYALHTTNFDAQPLSENSFRLFRRKVEAYNKEHGCDLIKDEFERISKEMAVNMGILHRDPDAEGLGVDPVIVRMDSMEIEAHAKAMGRLEILYTSNILLIRYLIKNGFGELIPEKLYHYCKDGDRNRIVYHRRPKDKEGRFNDSRIGELVEEMLLLKKIMEENFGGAVLDKIPEYSIFMRVLNEQTVKDKAGNIVPKSDSNISPDSVQNPFDATVTYRYKHGRHHGFVMNVAEVVDGKGNGIITSAAVEPNTRSDADLAEEYLRALPENGSRQQISADGAYDKEGLHELARQKNVEICNTALSGSQPYDIDADFTLNAEGTEIIECPAGYKPAFCKYNEKSGRITAKMPDNCCLTCPHKDECNVYHNKKKTKSSVSISKKMVRRAEQARYIKTEKGIINTKVRNGVEGIMSVMRRKYNIDRIPQFGIERVRNWIWVTLISYNLVKYHKYLNPKKRTLPVQG